MRRDGSTAYRREQPNVHTLLRAVRESGASAANHDGDMGRDPPTI